MLEQLYYKHITPEEAGAIKYFMGQNNAYTYLTLSAYVKLLILSILITVELKFKSIFIDL